MSTDRSVPKLVLGVDPGLNNTGWGLVLCKNNIFEYIASGTIHNLMQVDTHLKLKAIYDGLIEVIERYLPVECAVEETFVNSNKRISLKLGYAKGTVLLVAAQKCLPIFEYAPCSVKKALTSDGQASKSQMSNMISCLMPRHNAQSEHEADALSIAICHINTLQVMQL
jgi:crossover junction endodeoxyribonuclease RuvC